MDKLKQPAVTFFVAGLMLFGFMQLLIPMPVPMHYVFIITSMLLIVTSTGEGVTVNYACVMFLTALVVSILGNKIPVFFKPWQRFALFFMMFVGCSPMLSGPAICRVRRQMTMGAHYAMLLVAVLSFVGYFAGFGKRLTGIVDSYMGITSHPNFLGFFTMVSMVFVASLFFRCTKMWERVVYISLWVTCLITLLLASSRSALALALVGTIIEVYLRYQKNATAMINTVVVLVCAVILSLPLLIPYMESMMKKNMDFDDSESVLADTRGSIWELRYQEIDESPIIGVGAYSCDITLENADIFYDDVAGNIEQGSSYLGITAQTGYFGLIAFLLIALPIIWKVIRYAFRERTPYAQMWLPVILVIAGNMIFEGYLITAGAVQCIVLWLTLGAADQCDKVADYPVFWEKWPPITPEQYEHWRENIAEDGDKR